MNKERRANISSIKNKLSELMIDLEAVKDEEEFAYDNMPESLQYSMRGEESQEAIDSLNNAIDQIEEAISFIEEVV